MTQGSAVSRTVPPVSPRHSAHTASLRGVAPDGVPSAWGAARPSTWSWRARRSTSSRWSCLRWGRRGD